MIHSFSVVIDGVELFGEDSPDADALYEAGCDDALLASEYGVQQAIFDREAPTFAEAVGSAIAAIESLPHARVISVKRMDPAGAEELQHSA